jgi:hydrogenase maturation protease
VKPHLVIGLGNPLMGDEGVAFPLVEALRQDPRLPEDVEVLWGDADLLGCADKMTGRTRVTLLDALLDPSDPGALCIFDGDFDSLDTGQPSAHQLSAVGAIELLRITDTSLREVRFKLLAVAVSSADMRPELSPALAAKLPGLLDQVLTELA